ncbi:MAG: CoA transferase [Anaerolineae bacterium]|nr:CoA transferase [Anaerolineae bacterium]
MINRETTLNNLLTLAERPLSPNDTITIEGHDPLLPTNYLLGTAGAAVIAATGLAASDLWQLRTGRRQTVTVSMRAAAAALRSHHYLRVKGEPARNLWDPISGFYETADKRWIQLHCNFPHHRAGVVRLLGCEDSREGVTQAVATWTGQDLEDALAQAQMCAGLVRSREEWQAHPQAKAVEQLPLFEIIKIGDSQPEPLIEGKRPLSGIRTLDLTRVIAGPVGGRTLAEHGANVMRIGSAHLPHIPPLVIDTGFGKRSAQLDLRTTKDLDQLRHLVTESDIFLQSYRPDALAHYGLTPEALAQIRPGLIYVTLSAYGHQGPWQKRRGFDSLVQSVSGIVDEESGGGSPQHLPAQALDYLSGYLLAFGAMVALARRACEGGSYLVRVSLCQTSHWLHKLGRTGNWTDHRLPDLSFDGVQDLLMTAESSFGALRHLAPVVQLSETTAYWSHPPVPLGHHKPTFS